MTDEAVLIFLQIFIYLDRHRIMEMSFRYKTHLHGGAAKTLLELLV